MSDIEVITLSQAVETIKTAILQSQARAARNVSANQLALYFSRDVFDIELAHDFLSISFTHHMEILNKTNSLEQRLFYIQKSAEFNWNKYELRDQLKKDLYGHQSLMPNNFLKSLPKHSLIDSNL